ncbi:MAG: DUF420 domain-containing protein [Planctomycetota bacterium]|nr:MAG: DUF420 domain-containing protein [Planctomycetota bacterium]
MDGFLGYRSTFMLDFVVVSFFALIPLTVYGVVLAKRGRYRLHARWMSTIVGVLCVVVAAFEWDIRSRGGVEEIVKEAHRLEYIRSTFFQILFGIHLFLVVVSVVFVIWTIIGAVRHFGFRNPVPTDYGKRHRRLGLSALISGFWVAVTGLMLYYFAFIA